MQSHAPVGYRCPFCAIAKGIEADYCLTLKSDVFFEDGFTMAFIAAGGWKTNPGHALVIPKRHFENIYTIRDGYLARVNILARQVAIAIKTVYGCEGITIRQNNEPRGGQDIWHYHTHVIPRWTDDALTSENMTRWTPEERAPYAQKLRLYFEDGKNGEI